MRQLILLIIIYKNIISTKVIKSVNRYLKCYLSLILLCIISACSASDIGLPDYISAEDDEANLVNTQVVQVRLNFFDSNWIKVPDLTINNKTKLIIDLRDNTYNLCPTLTWHVAPTSNETRVLPPSGFRSRSGTKYTLMIEKLGSSEQAIQCSGDTRPIIDGERLTIKLNDTIAEQINSPYFTSVGKYYITTFTGNGGLLSLSVNCANGTGGYHLYTYINSDECKHYYNSSRSTTAYDNRVGIVSYNFSSINESINTASNDGRYILNLKNNQIDTSSVNDESFILLKVNSPYFSSNSNTNAEFIATVRTYKLVVSTPIGDFLNSLITPVKAASLNASRHIFEGIINNTNFKKAIKASLILYITIYSIMFTIGMTRINHKDLLERAIKIGLILILISENSWVFFNEYCLNLFTKGMENLLYYLTGTETTDSAGVFSFIDKIFQDVFAANNLLKLSSIAINLHGFVMFVMVIIFIFSYLFVILESFIGYLIAILCISLMISLAPLFLPLFLFENSKKYFEGWLKYLINFTIQPVILFTMINILNYLLIIAYKSMLNFSVEWGPVIPIFIDLNFIFKILGLDFVSFPVINLFHINYYVPNVPGDFILTTFKTVMVFGLLVSVMKVVTDLAPKVSDSLTSVSQGSGTEFTGGRSIASRALDNVTEKAKSVVGADRGSKERRAKERRVDEAMN